MRLLRFFSFLLLLSVLLCGCNSEVKNAESTQVQESEIVESEKEEPITNELIVNACVDYVTVDDNYTITTTSVYSNTPVTDSVSYSDKNIRTYIRVGEFYCEELFVDGFSYYSSNVDPDGTEDTVYYMAEGNYLTESNQSDMPEDLKNIDKYVFEESDGKIIATCTATEVTTDEEGIETKITEKYAFKFNQETRKIEGLTILGDEKNGEESVDIIITKNIVLEMPQWIEKAVTLDGDTFGYKSGMSFLGVMISTVDATIDDETGDVSFTPSSGN